MPNFGSNHPTKKITESPFLAWGLYSLAPNNGESNGKENGKTNGNWDYRVVILGLYRGYIGITENKMETTIVLYGTYLLGWPLKTLEKY